MEEGSCEGVLLPDEMRWLQREIDRDLMCESSLVTPTVIFVQPYGAIALIRTAHPKQILAV